MHKMCLRVQGQSVESEKTNVKMLSGRTVRANDSLSEGCGFEPRQGQCVTPLNKVLGSFPILHTT